MQKPLARARVTFPVVAFLATAGGLLLVATASAAYLPIWDKLPVLRFFSGRPWLDAWARWDAAWYRSIAVSGYWFDPQAQSPVAFFPAFPLLMRLGSRLGLEPALAGMTISLASGLGGTVLFHRWCLLRMDGRDARVAVLTLFAYPFAFFLFGAVYADGLFLLTVLVAFLLLEADRPWAAGLAAAVATATRPVGLAVVAGLWLRALERRGALGPGLRIDLRTLTRRDAGLLLAPGGLAAYCAFLWIRFGRPFAFVQAVGAPGWDEPQGPATWFKLTFVRSLAHGPVLGASHARLLLHASVTLVAILLVPVVFRRFGPGYGVYALAAVALPALASKDFVGVGRYLLAAFPCFAAGGQMLAARPAAARRVLSISGALMVALTSLWARYYYVS